jgi:hypothetical protein
MKNPDPVITGNHKLVFYITFNPKNIYGLMACVEEKVKYKRY